MNIFTRLKEIANMWFKKSSVPEMELQPKEILQLVGGCRIHKPLDFQENGFRDTATMLRKMASRFEDGFKDPLKEMADALDRANTDRLSREFGAVVPVKTIFELLDMRGALIRSTYADFRKAMTGDATAQSNFMESAALYRGLVNIANTHEGSLYLPSQYEHQNIMGIIEALPPTNKPAIGDEQDERFDKFLIAVEEQRQRGMFRMPALERR